MEQLYSLLRNNKTSGPYSVHQLAHQQLVSTDLVWVEGKSNSWISACEVDTLSEMVCLVKTSTEAKVYHLEEEDLQLVVKYQRSLAELRAEYVGRSTGKVRRLPGQIWKNETISLLVMLALFVISFFAGSDYRSSASNQHSSINKVGESADLLQAPVSIR